METMKSLCDSFYCRLCAEENKNGTYLFPEEENSYNLSLLINKYLPIKVENDEKFPKYICPGCHIQLEATKSFMDLIIEGQTKLRNLYRTQQETLQREDKQRQKLEEALHNVNPNSSVETYTIQSDETGEKFVIQIYSDGPLFPPEHELALRAEGLDKPKRKRGRPPKREPDPASDENESEVRTEADNNKNTVQDEEMELDADGRRRRKIKAPSRYQGIVQGEELDKIFKEEGVLDEEEIDAKEVQPINHTEEIIGRTETENGEDLGEPVIVNKAKLKTGYCNKRKGKKKYQCEICKREFLHIGHFELHRKSHNIQYVCQEVNCNVENENKTEVHNHQSVTGHSGISPVGKFESVEGMLQLPENPTVIQIQEPSASESPQPPSHRCEECSKTFTCKQNLDVHNRAVHNQEKPFTCDKCDKSFSYANSLKLHMLKHDKEARLNNADGVSPKEYPCEACGKVLQHPSSLLYHKETEHSNGRRFVCNKCDKSFKHRQLLQRHQLVHSDERPYQCQQCDATFKTHANLTNHEGGVHSGEKKYVCNQCGQKFAHRTSLTLHQRWHEGHKPYTCDVCHKAFSQKGNLAEHKRIHTGEKPYCCDHCGRSFTTSSQFNLHRKRHTGERPWSCEYCSKTFLHKDTFKAHVRRHLNDRPFKCNNCPRAFTEAWALKRHERIHSGAKPYFCGQCGKTFADSSNKAKHMRTHNTVNNIKHIYKNNNLKDAYNGQSVYEMKEGSLLRVIAPSVELEQQVKVNVEASDLQLTQLVDQQGNPISITTQDGQTVPVVTGANDENSIQGLLPDGTLVPIEITTMQEKDLVEVVDEEESTLLTQNLQDEINILKDEDIIKGQEETQKLDTNICLTQQFITDVDGQEMCLVTYTMNETNSINQQLGIDTFLIHDIKK